jgi:hypothetical protein
VKPLPDADGLALGDVARLRKKHPCGSYEWRIVRLGADIGLRCLGCDHKVLLPRSRFRKSLKAIVTHAASEAEPAGGDTA